MTRQALAALALLGLAACMGEPSAPTDPTSLGRPDFAISDAFHGGGSPDFLWRPPMVPNNSLGTGTFNPNLSPTVRICARNADNTACVATVATFTNVPVVAGQYQKDWTVPVNATVFYRVFVEVAGSSGPVVLGFADVQTAANKNGLKNVDPNQFVPVTDGSILPIKFRINSHCTGTCSEGYIVLADGGTVFYKEGDDIIGGASIPPQTGDGRTVTVTITRCPGGNLPIDLPLFGSCLTVLTNPELVGAGKLNVAGTIFVCDAPGVADDLDNPAQEELVTLHRKHGTDPVQALPHAPDQCTPIVIGSVRGLLRALVHGRWNAAGRQLAALIGPAPLYARRLDAGAGGFAEEFSDFQFALPAKMEVYNPPVEILDNTIQVIVTDLHNEPVANAKVHFAAASGNGSVTPLLYTTGANGIASATWTIPVGTGTFQATASGVGIADILNDGPRTGSECSEGDCFFDPFMAIQQVFDDCDPGCPALTPVNLETGVVTFQAFNSSSVLGSASVQSFQRLPAAPAQTTRRVPPRAGTHIRQ